ECMSVLADAMALINKIDSQDELRQINSAVNSRWRQLQQGVSQKMVQDKALFPGCPVSFFARGQTIYGTVKTINPKSVSVTPQGGGQHWKVSPQLLKREEKLPEQKALSEDDLMEAILGCYNRLSPENLAADGERPRHEQIRLSRELNARLDTLFFKLGRRVSETAAYAWWDEHKGIAGAI
ncbi:MAG: hypothetical protein ACRD6W_01825, partial [Nitrososphaerales archaeon]